MHWYEGVRADFYEQLLSEIKIPSRTNPRKRAWKPRTDRRNEGLDCTVYAIYLCRHLRLHVKKPWEWDVIEMRVKQAELRLGDPATDAPPPPDLKSEPAPPVPATADPVATPEAEVHTSAPAPAPVSQADYLAMINKLRRPRRG